MSGYGGGNPQGGQVGHRPRDAPHGDAQADGLMYTNGMYDVPKRKPVDPIADLQRQRGHAHPSKQVEYGDGVTGNAQDGSWMGNSAYEQSGSDMSSDTQTSPGGAVGPPEGRLMVEDVEGIGPGGGMYSNGTYDISENMSDASSDTVNSAGRASSSRGRQPQPPQQPQDHDMHDVPGAAPSGHTSRSNSGRGMEYGGPYGASEDMGGFGGAPQPGSGSTRGARLMAAGGGPGPLIMKSGGGAKRGMEGMFSSILGGGGGAAPAANARVNSMGMPTMSLRDQFGNSSQQRRGQWGKAGSTRQMMALRSEEEELADEGDYRFDAPSVSPPGQQQLRAGGAGAQGGFAAGPAMAPPRQSVFSASMAGHTGSMAGGGGGSSDSDDSDDDDVAARPLVMPGTAKRPVPLLLQQEREAALPPAAMAARAAAHQHQHVPEHAVAAASAARAQAAAAATAAFVPYPVAASLEDDRARFLMAPGPRASTCQCYIVRSKGRMGTWPTFQLFLEDGGAFLLSARRRKKSKTSNFLISLDPGDLARDSDNFFGKLRSNYVGTEYVLYDNGTSLKKLGKKGGEEDGEGAGGERREVSAVRFKQTALTKTGGPRQMTCVVPDPEEGDLVGESAGSSLVECYHEMKAGNSAERPVLILKNKKPTWDDNIKANCLDFSGRVTEASVKNFQLCVHDMSGREEEGTGKVVLQFGKMGGDRFALDYSWPLSPLQALGIALASVDGKLCYTM